MPRPSEHTNRGDNARSRSISDRLEDQRSTRASSKPKEGSTHPRLEDGLAGIDVSRTSGQDLVSQTEDDPHRYEMPASDIRISGHTSGHSIPVYSTATIHNAEVDYLAGDEGIGIVIDSVVSPGDECVAFLAFKAPRTTQKRSPCRLLIECDGLRVIDLDGHPRQKLVVDGLSVPADGSVYRLRPPLRFRADRDTDTLSCRISFRLQLPDGRAFTLRTKVRIEADSVRERLYGRCQYDLCNDFGSLRPTAGIEGDYSDCSG